MRVGDFLSVVTAACLWGTGGVLGALIAERAEVPAASIAMWRMGVAGAFLLIYLALRGTLKLGSLSRAMWIRCLVTAALTAAFEVGYFAGIALASVGLATMIAIGSAPVCVALFDWWVRHERPSPRVLAALALALAGLVLLMSGAGETGPNAPLGAAVALATGAAFAAITIVNRVPVQGLEPARLTGVAFSAGAVMLVPVALLSGIGGPDDALSWTYLLALGIGATALAYVAFLRGLRTVPPFVATVVALLEPLIAAVLGAIVFSERLGPAGIVGGAALALAVVLLRPQRDAPEPPH